MICSKPSTPTSHDLSADHAYATGLRACFLRFLAETNACTCATYSLTALIPLVLHQYAEYSFPKVAVQLVPWVEHVQIGFDLQSSLFRRKLLLSCNCKKQVLSVVVYIVCYNVCVLQVRRSATSTELIWLTSTYPTANNSVGAASSRLPKLAATSDSVCLAVFMDQQCAYCGIARCAFFHCCFLQNTVIPQD